MRLVDAIEQAATAAETTPEDMTRLVDSGIITRPYADMDAVNDVLAEVRVELLRALFQHEPMHSTHEGLAVIDEERHELMLLVYEGHGAGRGERAHREALQVAAMGLRYALDVAPAEEPSDG